VLYLRSVGNCGAGRLKRNPKFRVSVRPVADGFTFEHCTFSDERGALHFLDYKVHGYLESFMLARGFPREDLAAGGQEIGSA
jgi:hypothetical protein